MTSPSSRNHSHHQQLRMGGGLSPNSRSYNNNNTSTSNNTPPSPHPNSVLSFPPPAPLLSHQQKSPTPLSSSTSPPAPLHGTTTTLQQCLLELICHTRWVCWRTITASPPEYHKKYLHLLEEARETLREISFPMMQVNDLVDIPPRTLSLICDGSIYLLAAEPILCSNSSSNDNNNNNNNNNLARPHTMHPFLEACAKSGTRSPVTAQLLAIRWFTAAGILNPYELVDLIFKSGGGGGNDESNGNNNNSQEHDEDTATPALAEFESEEAMFRAIAEKLADSQYFFVGAHIVILRGILNRYCLELVIPEKVIAHFKLACDNFGIHDNFSPRAANRLLMKAKMARSSDDKSGQQVQHDDEESAALELTMFVNETPLERILCRWLMTISSGLEKMQRKQQNEENDNDDDDEDEEQQQNESGVSRNLGFGTKKTLVDATGMLSQKQQQQQKQNENNTPSLQEACCDGVLLSRVIQYFRSDILPQGPLHSPNNHNHIHNTPSNHHQHQQGRSPPRLENSKKLSIWNRQENWGQLISALEQLDLWVGIFAEELVEYCTTNLQLHMLRIVEEVFCVLVRPDSNEKNKNKKSATSIIMMPKLNEDIENDDDEDDDEDVETESENESSVVSSLNNFHQEQHHQQQPTTTTTSSGRQVSLSAIRNAIIVNNQANHNEPHHNHHHQQQPQNRQPYFLTSTTTKTNPASFTVEIDQSVASVELPCLSNFVPKSMDEVTMILTTTESSPKHENTNHQNDEPTHKSKGTISPDMTSKNKKNSCARFSVNPLAKSISVNSFRDANDLMLKQFFVRSGKNTNAHSASMIGLPSNSTKMTTTNVGSGRQQNHQKGINNNNTNVGKPLNSELENILSQIVSNNNNNNNLEDLVCQLRKGIQKSEFDSVLKHMSQLAAVKNEQQREKEEFLLKKQKELQDELVRSARLQRQEKELFQLQQQQQNQKKQQYQNKLNLPAPVSFEIPNEPKKSSSANSRTRSTSAPSRRNNNDKKIDNNNKMANQESQIQTENNNNKRTSSNSGKRSNTPTTASSARKPSPTTTTESKSTSAFTKVSALRQVSTNVNNNTHSIGIPSSTTEMKELMKNQHQAALSAQELYAQHQAHVAQVQASLQQHPNLQVAKRNNRAVITNALRYVCLPGPVNKPLLDIAVKSMDEEPQETTQFVVLLKEEGSSFKGLYAVRVHQQNHQEGGNNIFSGPSSAARAFPENGDDDQELFSQNQQNNHNSNQFLYRIFGTGPLVVKADVIGDPLRSGCDRPYRAFKFDTGSKRFSGIAANLFSNVVDAVTLWPKLRN